MHGVNLNFKKNQFKKQLSLLKLKLSFEKFNKYNKY